MIEKIIIGSWMKRQVYSIHVSATVVEAAKLLIDKKVGTLPVLDEGGRLVGEVAITDIVQILLPDFVSLLDNIDFVKDFGALRQFNPDEMEKVKKIPITKIMKPPIHVDEDCSLIRAISIMNKHNLRDLPVVRGGKLVGLASWVDIGRAFLCARLSLELEEN